MKPHGSIYGFGLGILLLSLPARGLAQDCAALTGLSLDDTTIVSATSQPAGTFMPPVPGQPPANVVAHCRVVARIAPTADSDILFEVWLPSAGWNGKLMGIGNSGLAGAINYTTFGTSLADALNRGYAATGTDTGHTGSQIDGSWAIGHPKKVVDHAYRALHRTTLNAKAIAKAFYGEKPAHAYFNGCSSGGRQGLLEAQRYPKDYDGVIAGAPVNFNTHLAASSAWIAQQTLGDPARYIPSSKLPAISSAVLAACDAIDGVVDGLVDDPRRCDFDPGAIQCTDADSSSCLTAPQVSALKAIYRGPRNPRTGERIFPGLERGGELGGPLGWGVVVTGPAPGQSADAALARAFFSGLVFEDPSYDILTFDFDEDMAFTDDKLAELLNATDPDLSEFRDQGGKLIMYHGWSDGIVAPRNSIDYYKSVAQAAGGRRKAITFARLFMAPGMDHCFGGSGPFVIDPISALEAWVEDGEAPDSMSAAHIAGNGSNPTSTTVDRVRVLCRFPLSAVYDGSGSIDDPSNFSCQRRSGDGDGED